MMTYNRNRKPASQPKSTRPEATMDGGRSVDGFAQVLEMLEMADPAFRESILKRLAAKDPQLAAQLKTRLG